MTPCKRLEVQAVGIDKAMNIAYTKNGNTHICLDIPGKCGCIHAEANLLDRMPNPLVVILSHSPCFECAKLLYAAGTKKILYTHKYRLLEGINYLVSKGISVEQI